MLGDHRCGGAEVQLRQLPQCLIGAVGLAHRQGQQLGCGLQTVLRRLSGDCVLHTVGRVEPERGRSLEAARQVDQQVLGDIALCQIDLARPAAIDGELQLGPVKGLLQA